MKATNTEKQISLVHPANEYLQGEKGQYLIAVNSAPGGSRVSLALKGF